MGERASSDTSSAFSVARWVSSAASLSLIAAPLRVSSATGSISRSDRRLASARSVSSLPRRPRIARKSGYEEGEVVWENCWNAAFASLRWLATSAFVHLPTR